MRQFSLSSSAASLSSLRLAGRSSQNRAPGSGGDDPKTTPLRRLRRWAIGGACLGLLVTFVSQAPAVWLTHAIDQATGGRFQLVEAQGTIWKGSALPLLTGGTGSRDAAVLPSRLHWHIKLTVSGLNITLQQPGNMPQPITLNWRAGLRGGSATLQAPPGGDLGTWPVAWLQGLGAPFNTLQPAGELHIRLGSPSLVVVALPTGPQLTGSLQMELQQLSSKLVPLDAMGSYSLRINGQPEGRAAILLQTLQGPLQLSGTGELRAGRLHFKGEAEAQSGFEPALSNLLNIIGRRRDAKSVFSIG